MAFLESSMSRRVFTFGGAGIITTLAGGEILSRQGSVTEAYSEYVKEYPRVSDKRRDQLLFPIRSVRVPHMEYSGSKNRIKDIAFRLSAPGLVVARFEGALDPAISLPVLEAKFKRLRYQVPITQTEEQAVQRIPFAASRGEHIISLSYTSGDNKLPAEKIHVDLSVVRGTEVFTTIMHANPIVGMLKENFLHGESVDQSSFFRTTRLRENEEGMLIAEFFEGRTREKGGSSPQELYYKKKRTYDHDVIFMIKMTPKGDIVEYAYQQDIGGNDHQITIVPVDPPRKRIPTLLHSVEDHGMVNEGLELITDYDELTQLREVELHDEAHKPVLVDKVTSLFPEFLQKAESPTISLDRARKIIALRLQRQAAMDIVDPPNGSDVVYTADIEHNIRIVHFVDDRLRELHAA